MNRAEVDAWSRYEAEERRKREKVHTEIVDYYWKDKRVHISTDFLEILYQFNTWLYNIFMNKEEVPVEVANWLMKRVL